MILENLKKVNKPLLLTLSFAVIAPIIYSMFKIVWITNDGSSNYSMITFESYIQAFVEVFSAFLILPLFTYNESELNKKGTSLFMAIILASTIMFASIAFLSIPVANNMILLNPGKEFIEMYSYLLVIGIADAIYVVQMFLIADIALGKQNVKATIMVSASIFIRFVFDLVLLSNLFIDSDSILLVSISSMLSALVTTTILIVLFVIDRIKKTIDNTIDWNVLLGFYKRGFYPGIDKLIGNFFYTFVTLKIVNSLDEVGWNSWHLGMWIYWHVIFNISNIFRYSLVSETLNNDRDIDVNLLTKTYMSFDVIIFIILVPLLTFTKLPNVVNGDSASDAEWLKLTMQTSLIMMPFMLSMAMEDKLKVRIIAENKMGYLVITTAIVNFGIEFPVLIAMLFGVKFNYWENFVIWMSVISLSMIITSIWYWKIAIRTTN